MFPYDAVLLEAVKSSPNSIADVLEIMGTIQSTCIDGDGLKWFNWLYLRVTQAVKARIDSGDFANPQSMTDLDVQFAKFYFGALKGSLTGTSCPECWSVLFNCRGATRTARIQFALSGINAHINHDLAEAIVATCKMDKITPSRSTSQYNDYTALNTALNSLIDTAKQALYVRLLGDSLPPVSHLEDTMAAWSVCAAREKAWQNAQILWQLQGSAEMTAGFMDSLDGLTSVVGKALLVPVP